jgi:hypothetical protein
MNNATPTAGSKSYTTWKLSFPLLDDKNRIIEIIEGVQELYVGPDEFIVRVTRAVDSATVRYEDRGTINAGGAIAGKSGFGGKLTGQLLKDNFGVLLEGAGGDADFILGAVVITPDHNRCFRQFEVRASTTLFGRRVEPGRYFTTSDDYLISSADDKPPELQKPLARGG